MSYPPLWYDQGMNFTVTREKIRIILQIEVSEATVRRFNALDEALRVKVLAGSEDLQRMFLMVLEQCVSAGWEMQPLDSSEALSCSGGTKPLCVLPEPGELVVSYGDEELRFTANYYGQMQLHQWLESL
jgi:hypothetical protein